MKTLTEFSGFVLKEAIAKKAALLGEGKTEDEAQASINEFLKLDETKAPFYKNAVDMTSSRVDRVKRVVVAIRATETEKVPESFSEREGHFYLVEFFPSSDSRAPSRGRDDDHFSRGRSGGGGSGRGREGGSRDRDGGGRGRGGNDRGGGDSWGRRPEGEPREPQAPRPDSGLFAKNTGLPSAAPRDAARPAHAERPARKPREPRAPRPEGAAPRGPRTQGPKGVGELRLVLKGQSTTLQGSGTNAPVESAESVVMVETPQITSPSTGVTDTQQA